MALGSVKNERVPNITSKITSEAGTRRPTIALLLPTLNELQGLKATVPLIDRSLVDDIIVIDGGSRDGTIEYAFDAGLTVVSQLRPGLHFAVFDIGRDLRTISSSSSVPMVLQGQNSCRSSSPRSMKATINVVRFALSGHALGGRPHHHRLGSWMFSRLMRPLARFPITDALNIYRGYRRDLLLDPDFEFYLRGPVLEPLVTGICALRGRATTEIPGDEPVRIGGVTKRSIIYNGSLVLWMIARLYVRKFLRRRL